MKTKEGLVVRSLGKEYVLVAEDIVNFNKIISLNSSAKFLWEEAAGKDFTVQDLADALVREYEIDMELALKDSEAIVAKWIEAGIATE